MQDLFPIATSVSAILLIGYLLTRLISKSKGPSLHPVDYRRFQLVKKTVISPNTALYRFSLGSPDASLGLDIGRHISVMAHIDGKEVVRSYTPTSSNSDLGYFELLIKSYPTGNVSKRIGELRIGDSIHVRGPKGNFYYKENMVAELGMVAGGTGITPMWQITQAILTNPNDRTRISLIFANVNEEDILLKKELDQLTKDDRFKVYYVLNNPPQGWTGGVGFVTADMIRQHLPPPRSDVKILLCGPPPMMKAMSECCEQVGFDKSRAVSKADDQVYKF
jgi:cytochrome-b5 reductase